MSSQMFSHFQQISPEVFKGLASLLKHAVKGIEQVGEGVNTCGIGSIFTLMEVAYTRHMGAYGKYRGIQFSWNSE